MRIVQLLKAPESKILEFKRDLSSPQNLLKTLVAFANTAGGRVIIGVEDKTRRPVGIETPLDEEERLCNLIADAIAPRLVPNVELTTVDGKTLLVVEVFLSNSRPHYLRSQGPDTGVYVRLGSTNRQADRELIAELRHHIELYDHLPPVVDSIMLFLKKHAMRGADFSEIRRRDVWSIPLEPLREAVINALVHADWSQRGGPVRIAFFNDRIEIENPGILPPGITVEDMKQGVSKIRNPVIARVFRELNLIEQWGSGVPRIFRETAESGFPEPYITELGLRTRFVFPLGKTIPAKELGRSGVQLPTQSTDPVDRLLKVLTEGPFSSGELRKRLNLKHRPTFRENYLHPALEKGYIEMTIPEKPKSRLQKYRLTKRGKKILRELLE